MIKNVGYIDRIIRLLLAMLIIVLYYTDVISGTVALVIMIVMGILLITSFFSFCPLYYPFGINTKKKI
jgi:uncharacterized RDD family membrane protein YckC